MEIKIETNNYNQRRYGKPWIAIVDFAQSTQGDFKWGDWTGDHYNGGDGILTINANPGDIVATGQKDNRQPKNSAPRFFSVNINGDLESIGDKGSAYKYYLDNNKNTPDVGAIKAEKDNLLKRLAEIDAIIGGN